MFKHVRGDGKHFLQELNGVKQLMCATSVTLASYGSHIRQKLSSFFPCTDAGCESHQRAFRTHPVLVLYHMSLFDFPLYRGVVTEHLFRLTEPYYASARS